MNILLLSPWSGDVDDERKLRHYYLIKELSNDNINIDMVVEGVKDKRGKRLIKNTKSSIVYSPSIKTGKIKITKMFTRFMNMILYIAYGLYVGISNKRKYDKIWVSVPHIGPSFIGLFLNKIFKKKLIYEIRDPWPKLLIDLNIIKSTGFIAKILQKLDTEMLIKSEYIISPNYNIDYIDLRFKNKIIIFPNAIADEILKMVPFKNKQREDIIHYIYAGGAANSYMLDIVLKAFSMARKEKNKFKLHLYLDDREIKRFKPYVEKIGIDDIVLFNKKVDQLTLFEKIANCDYYIFHLKDLEMFRPGISSNKLMDPLICGRPVIMGANIKNNWVKDSGAGIVVRPEDSNSLKNAILLSYQIRQTSRYDNMCLKAYKYAREKLSLKTKVYELKQFGIFS